MLNRLSETKFFNLGNIKYDYGTTLSKVNFSKYKIPEEFYIDKVRNFKGFHYPMVNEIIKAIEDGHILLGDLNQSNDYNYKPQDMRLATHWPSSIYNMELMEDGEIKIFVDLSSKGKYSFNPNTKEAFYYEIDPTILFAMCTAGYISYKLTNNEDISRNISLVSTIAEAYALIMDKVFSPLLSTNNVIDTSKIHMLSYAYCLQSMFNLDKEMAVKLAMKSKFVVDKHGVEDTSYYCQSDEDIMSGCDYKSVFPIDRFCTIVTKEFEYITDKICNPGKLAKQFDDWFNRNALFTLEHSKSFITMLVFCKYGIDIFNNFRLKTFLTLASGDIVKDIAQVIR